MYLPILMKSAESYFFQYFTSRFTQKLRNLEMFHSVDFGKLLFSEILTKFPTTWCNLVLIWFLLQFVVGSAHFGPRLTGLHTELMQRTWNTAYGIEIGIYQQKKRKKSYNSNIFKIFLFPYLFLFFKLQLALKYSLLKLPLICVGNQLEEKSRAPFQYDDCLFGLEDFHHMEDVCEPSNLIFILYIMEIIPIKLHFIHVLRQLPSGDLTIGCGSVVSRFQISRKKSPSIFQKKRALSTEKGIFNTNATEI